MKQYIAGELKRRVRTGKNNQPLRTITELAEEFGVSVQSLAGYLKNRENSPKPELKTQSKRSKNTWYKPIEMRAWWKSLDIRKE